MVCSLFDYLTKSIAITDSMFNFGKFFTKNVITFAHLCYASNSAIKNLKITRNIFFFNKIVIFPKNAYF